MSRDQEKALYEAWLEWAKREIGGSDAQVEAGARAAVDAAILTRDNDATIAAARLAAIEPGRARALAVKREIAHADYVVSELERFQASYPRRPLTLADAVAWYRRRRLALAGPEPGPAVPAKPVPASAETPPATVAVPGPVDPTPTAPPPGPAATAADQGVLILSYVGAFLLIIATLLFEVYGLGGLNGPTQFVLVLALNVFFGGVGWACLGNPRLRVVGNTYVGIFALTTPLVLVAAYEFLFLKQYGISAEAALFVGGLYCFLLYGVLAGRLESAGYAWLSLAALPFAAYGGVSVLGLRDWTGVAFAQVAVAYVLLSQQRDGPQRLRIFRTPGEVMVHVAAALSIVASLSLLGRELAASPPANALVAPYLPVTFAALTGVYSVYVRLRRETPSLWLVAVGTSLTLLSAVVTVQGGSTGAALMLVVLAAGYAAGSRLTDDAGLVTFLRAGAAAQALACAAFPLHPDPLQALVLVAAAGVGVFLTTETSQPLWLLLSGALFAYAWYWIARVVIPPPANPARSTLVLTYSPLPVIYLLLGVVGSRRFAAYRMFSWTGPMEWMAAFIAAWVLLGALGVADILLFGWVTIVYAGVVYALAVQKQQAFLAPFAVMGAAIGIFALLVHAGTSAWAYPLIYGFISAGVYFSQLAFVGPGEQGWEGLAEAHRYTGLVLAGLTALGCFGVPAFYQAGSSGALTSLAATLGFSLLLLAEQRLHHIEHLDLAAAFVASIGLDWLVHYLGADNPQYYVLAPGLCLVGIGMVLQRRSAAQRAVARVLVGTGAAVLLGTTFLQTSAGSGSDSLYTALLVAEGVAAISLGVGLRNRTIVVSGATGVALAALRALFQVVQEVPLSVVFGALALVILGVAAMLALGRDQLREAGGSAGALWKEWD